MAIKPDTISHRILSFRYAIEGILSTFKLEPNFKFHVLAGTLVVILGMFFQITKDEWLTVVIMITIVIALELTNTSIESVVDLLSPDYHINAKRAKDISAGAVFISALGAAICGAIIFLPYVFKLIF